MPEVTYLLFSAWYTPDVEQCAVTRDGSSTPRCVAMEGEVVPDHGLFEEAAVMAAYLIGCIWTVSGAALASARPPSKHLSRLVGRRP